MRDKPRILVAPLDWGLGHATRCVPVIEKLLSYNVDVVIAADNRPLEFLKKEFPHLQYINLPGVQVNYPKSGSMSLKMLRLMPKLWKSIKAENKVLKSIIKEHNIDAVISDNRYGLYSNDVYSVFITHQITIKPPVFIKKTGKLLGKITRFLINRFDECWIPDYEGKINLSGELSHVDNISDSIHFIGPLSRFFLDEESGTDEDYSYDFAAILSGPEPQRSIFQELLFAQLRKTDLRGVIVLGIPEKTETFKLTEDIEVHSHLPTHSLDEIMRKSRLIICRPGYTGIMDIGALGKKAILIPTPGQTEQEYLAEKFAKQNVYVCQLQKSFDLESAFEAINETNPLQLKYNPALLEERIEYMLEQISKQA